MHPENKNGWNKGFKIVFDLNDVFQKKKDKKKKKHRRHRHHSSERDKDSGDEKGRKYGR